MKIFSNKIFPLYRMDKMTKTSFFMKLIHKLNFIPVSNNDGELRFRCFSVRTIFYLLTYVLICSLYLVYHTKQGDANILKS